MTIPDGKITGMDAPAHLDAAPGGGAAGDAIGVNVGCPSCGYNLRGLGGEVVRCPECGTTCDVAALIARRWTGPWWRAPGFNIIVLPACWVIGACVMLAGADMFLSGGRVALVLELAAVVALVAVWLWLIGWVQRRFADRRAVAMALLAHAVLLSIIVGALVAVGGTVVAIVNLTGGGFLWPLVAGLIACVGGVLVALGRLGERLIATYCIRHHVQGAWAGD